MASLLPNYFVMRRQLSVFIISEKKNPNQVHRLLMSSSSPHVTPTTCADNTSQLHMPGSSSSITPNSSSFGSTTCLLWIAIRSWYLQSRMDPLQQNWSCTHSLATMLHSSFAHFEWLNRRAPWFNKKSHWGSLGGYSEARQNRLSCLLSHSK